MLTPIAANVPVSANVQPSSPRDLKHMPPGTRARDVVVIFSPVELRVADEIESLVGSTTMAVGDVYVVQTEGNWHEGEFWEVTALRRKGNLE